MFPESVRAKLSSVLPVRLMLPPTLYFSSAEVPWERRSTVFSIRSWLAVWCLFLSLLSRTSNRRERPDSALLKAGGSLDS